MELASQVREACAWVSAGARHVRVREEAIAGYAAALPEVDRYPPPAVDLKERGRSPSFQAEDRAALHLTLDAINFGSGWFPTLRKRDGRSGYFTVALGIRDRFEARGPWAAGQLASIEAAEVAEATGQDPAHELMELYARALRELGERVREDHGGSFLALATLPGLAEELASWPGFADVSTHRGRRVPLYKRAQITAHDMVCAGLIPPGAEGSLTAFADNLVPHVLRMDGVLEYDPELLARIDAGELLSHGSPEEVEIRAAAVHAIELIVSERRELSAPGVDNALWMRGQEPRYKAQPRHRARCVAY